MKNVQARLSGVNWGIFQPEFLLLEFIEIPKSLPTYRHFSPRCENVSLLHLIESTKALQLSWAVLRDFL